LLVAFIIIIYEENMHRSKVNPYPANVENMVTSY